MILELFAYVLFTLIILWVWRLIFLDNLSIKTFNSASERVWYLRSYLCLKDEHIIQGLMSDENFWMHARIRHGLGCSKTF